jgi:hypothetical protein
MVCWQDIGTGGFEVPEKGLKKNVASISNLI